MEMHMGGMVHGIMTLTVTASIFGAIITALMGIEFTQNHQRLPMSVPLLPSLEFNLTRNHNHFSPHRRLLASMAKSPFEPGRQLGMM
jgi:hypothetical protein